MVTPRQELVADAARKLRWWRFQGDHINRFGAIRLRTAHDAIEAAIDEWRGILSPRGQAIINYYRTASEKAIARLINEVEKGARA